MATQTTSFTYTIRDNTNATSTATVNVTIEDVIPPASAQDESRTVQRGSSILVDVLANDSPSGVVLDALVAPSPTKGTAVIENGAIRYTPSANTVGADSVGYRIRLTANNTTDVGVLNITIQVPAASGNRSGLPWPSGTTHSESLSTVNGFGTFRGRLIDITMLYPGGGLWGKSSPLATATLQWDKVVAANKLKSNGIVKTFLDANIAVVYAQCMLVQQERGQFALIASGARDSEHIQCANQIAGWYNSQPANYPQLWLCFGQEASTSSYPWSYGQRSNSGDSAQDYINAYRRVSNIYKDRIPRVKVTWNGLRNSADLNAHWPGASHTANGVIDAVTLDCYDNGFNNSWFQSAGQFDDWLNRGGSISSGFSGIDACRRYADSKGLPWGIQEWGPTWDDATGACPTASRNPNNPYYMNGIFAYLQDHANSCCMDIFFNNTINGCPPLGGGSPVQKHTIYQRQEALGVASDRYKANWTP